MFVDNSDHEYNAGIKMELTPDQLKSTLNQMSKLASRVKYDIDEYNCTDFALDVFNYSRPANPLEIPKYHLTASTAPDGSNTPQGLYKKLVQMQGVSVESPNITIPRVKQWAAKSNVPCN